jgi:hypothetical protein
MDVILVVAQEEELIKLHEGLTKEFLWDTMVIGNEQSYLGMLIKITDGEVSVNMHY